MWWWWTQLGWGTLEKSQAAGAGCIKFTKISAQQGRRPPDCCLQRHLRASQAEAGNFSSPGHDGDCRNPARSGIKPFRHKVWKPKTPPWWPAVKAQEAAPGPSVGRRRRLFDVVPAGAEDRAINLRLLQVRPEKPAILPPTLPAEPMGACDKGGEKEGDARTAPTLSGICFVPTGSRMGTGSPRGNANPRLAEHPLGDSAFLLLLRQHRQVRRVSKITYFWGLGRNKKTYW